MHRRRLARSTSTWFGSHRSSANSRHKAKFLLNSIEELLINDHWIKSGDGRWFYRAVPFTEIVFEHSDICFIAKDPVNMVAGKPPSLSGSKPVAVEDFGDLFVTNAAVT